MKILILSDIHGNWPALHAVLASEPDADQILCLGDIVNYGPQPAECVVWAMNNLDPDWLVQGNHDRAVGRDEDPHCSAAYQVLAAATQKANAEAITLEMKQFLAGLRPVQRFKLDAAVCVICHAAPSDPLYHYMPETSPVPLWESELNWADHPDFLFLGHTHLPMKMRFRRTLVVNPGSVGQPKDGDPRAAYAIWEDGEIVHRRANYDVEETIRAYRGLPLEPHVVKILAEVLRTGGHLPLDQTPYELFEAYYLKHPDKLEALFFLQKLLNRRVSVETERMTDAERQQWILNFCRVMIREVVELTDCVPWQWWVSYQRYNKQTARSKIVELLHLVISLAQVQQITPEELFEACTKKHRVTVEYQAPSVASTREDEKKRS